MAKICNQSKCPLTDEWLKKVWHICATEYNSAIKKNDILSFSATWMNLENIVLSKISQAKKTKTT
jgi:hypothetical protein